MTFVDDPRGVASSEIIEVGASPRSAVEHERRRSPKLMVAVVDLVAVVLSLTVAGIAASIVSDQVSRDDEQRMLVLSLLSLPLWPLVFARYRLYASRFITRGIDEQRRVVQAVIAGTASLAVLATALQFAVTRWWYVFMLIAGSVVVGFERRMVRRVFASIRRRGGLQRRIVIVGCNNEGLAIDRMFCEDPVLGYTVVGFVDDGAGDLTEDQRPSAPVLGCVADTADVVAATGASGVVIAATAMDLASSNRLIRDLTDAGVHVELSSTLRDVASDRLTVRPLGRFPVVYIEPVKRNGWRSVAKRTFDLAISAAVLVLTLPILATAAIAIKLDSRGTVLFRQTRVGMDGRLFEVLKLRTMVPDADAMVGELQHLNERSGPLFKMTRDPRVTRVGRVLRAMSVDELPQLWNVLKGEMSLVGPRPALPREIEDWGAELHRRLRVKPGITGMWQVHGRNNDSFEVYERLDLFYVENWSLVSDLVIIAQTLPAVLSRRGAK